MKPFLFRFALAAGVVALLFASLGLFYWRFVAETIVYPLYYLIQLIGLVIVSAPQEIYLIVLVILGGIIALTSIPRGQANGASHVSEDLASFNLSRYHTWLKLCANLQASQFSRSNFTLEARRLVLTLLAYQEGLERAEVEERLLQGTLVVPAAVKQLVCSGTLPLEPGEPSNRLPAWFERLWSRWRGEDPTANRQALKQAEEIIRFIEYRLEINQDGNKNESR